MKAIKFYILKDNKRHYVEPEREELHFAKEQIKWGMKKGVVILATEIRTSSVYWHI